MQMHPDWYARDYRGELRLSPLWDCSDIIAFDCARPSLREYMIQSMCYWIDAFDVDGFRCDVAEYVVNDF